MLRVAEVFRTKTHPHGGEWDGLYRTPSVSYHDTMCMTTRTAKCLLSFLNTVPLIGVALEMLNIFLSLSSKSNYFIEHTCTCNGKKKLRGSLIKYHLKIQGPTSFFELAWHLKI